MAVPAPVLTGAALAGLVGLLLLVWREGTLHMVGVWRSSPAYIHGFAVPFVSLGLIWDGWRRGERLAAWPPALLGLGAAAGIYMAGAWADIQLAQHLAVAGGIISLVALTMGRTFAVRHRFALLFLLCAVPIGEELVPLLQDITASAIIGTLHVLGIPAIRQGWLIRTEPGDFLVEEACAGLRFLVAMVVSGILLAHLLLRTRWKQFLLVGLCVVAPILANIVRAVTVVLMGVWSGMDVATGFDHLVYGWGLFAAVFALIFLLALWQSEKGAPARPTPPFAAETPSRPALWITAALILLVSGSVI